MEEGPVRTAQGMRPFRPTCLRNEEAFAVPCGYSQAPHRSGEAQPCERQMNIPRGG